MNLREYINQTGIPITKLSDRVGVGYHQLYYLLRGGKPSLTTALAIENYTRGLVRPIDFLTPEEQEDIYGQKTNQAQQAN